MKLVLTADEVIVHAVVGADTYLRGHAYASDGAVQKITWSDDHRVASGSVSGNSSRPYWARIAVTYAADGRLRSFAGTCTCPVGANCKHTVALLLAALPRPAADPRPDVDPDLAAWQLSLDMLIGGVRAASAVRPELALQFTAVDRDGAPGSVSIRPVLAGKNGWIRTGISWSNLGRLQYSRAPDAKRIHRLLSELVALHAAGQQSQHFYYASRPEASFTIASFTSRRVWDALADLQTAGVPLVQYGRPPAPVVLHDAADAVLDVRDTAEGMWVGPRLMIAGDPVPARAVGLLGQPAHGAAWREPGSATLHLAPLAAAPGAGPVLAQAPLVVPDEGRDRFLVGYLPRLRQLAPVVSTDGSVELPERKPPRLQLSIDHLGEHRIGLRWSWRYTFADATRAEPLWPANPGDIAGRDPHAEREILRAVANAARQVPALFESDQLVPEHVLGGMMTVRFLADVLPALQAMDSVEVAVGGDPADYRESESVPVISFDSAGTDQRDWFDLAVSVTVDGENVPFASLFTALAQGEPYLILPSGTYFTLDRPEFATLAALIEESRTLFDAEPGTVRLGRLHSGMWDELERLGVVDAQADAWRGAARALSVISRIDEHPLPSGLQATLRGYQVDGFNWLAFLFDHGLGGVLADEMGLGKTLQALALICHVREKGLSDAPFLVVAPTSVVHNWAAECGRFAPHLAVHTVTETAKRRGADLVDVAAGAAVVVTSYTLFRLEHEQYGELQWAGLIMDEAQFAKNRQTLAYQCAKKLDTAFKLAVTGTPLQNNVMELWSLLSITAPGLFPRPQKFEDYYRGPIEKGHDAERLDRLRRRIRPLMVRRTKADVLTDLPDKQEQVLELDLNPRHRKVYQTHLQRERQKVLGLLGDLEGNRFEIFQSLMLLRQASLDVGLVDPAHAKIPSTKLDALLDQLTEVVAEGHRAVVFSQFTRFLGLARRRLDGAGIGYSYLDGRTRRRSEAIGTFKDGAAPVFLISLKAGGFGLNLTEADYCFILDPWWNPATEAQAVDRIHRIGQTRKVMVYRLVARETIEEKVMALKAAKSALFDRVMDARGTSSGKLTAADIRGLIE